MKKIWKPWFEGKSFTAEWGDGHLPLWLEILSDRRDQSVEVLEIGSWEGRSAVCFLEYLPRSRITCVDTFEGGEEHKSELFRDTLGHIERRFDANMAGYPGRVEKIRSRSLPALDRLLEANRRYDIIYIDGSHEREDVMIDSVLSWKLLKDGGLLFWDDYLWGKNLPPSKRPMAAIDAFLQMVSNEFTIRSTGEQVIIEKTSSSKVGELKPGLVINAPARTVRNLIKFLKRDPIT